MADEITTTSHNDMTQATMVAPFIRRALSERGGLWRYCREFNLTINWPAAGISIPTENSFWGSTNDDGAGVDLEFDATQATDLANTAVTTGAVTCTPGEFGVALEVTKNVEEDSVGAIDLYGLLEERMLHAIDLAMVDDLCALFPSVSGSVGTSGLGLSTANLISAFQGLRTSAVDCDAIIGILDGVQATDVENDLVSANAAAAVFALSADRLVGYTPSALAGATASRQFMTFRGAPMISTGLTDTANAGADVVGCVFCPSTAYNDMTGATTFGMAWKRLPTLDTDKIVLGRSVQLVMTARAGFTELQDGSGRNVTTDA